MKYITAAFSVSFCLIASAAHAQGWAQALTALGAFSQGYQNGAAQRYNMERGYPAQIYQPNYQSGPSHFIVNGRVVTCFPLGSFISCQ